ncbi:MAG: CO dehydrogenase/acetyl-CoA synthase subunit delta [Candidatus Lokiarchaeota archaeon]|nr:CO dehydrogenase/acetyl-CoA synthase subunit delta [Candidatus Lokiarchaeota archaeon]
MDIEKLSKSLAKMLENVGEIEFDNVDLAAETLELHFLPQLVSTVAQQMVAPQIAAGKKLKDFEWEATKFELPFQQYTQKIAEITFKRSNGTTVKIGGETVPHFYGWEKSKNPNPPVVIYDVFDHVAHVPGPIKDRYGEDILHNPVEWAKLAVKKFGAQMLSLHFVSTDPAVKNTPPKESAKLMEDVLQAVKVPVSIGSSGNDEKDLQMFEAVAAATQGERLMLSAAKVETVDKVVPIAMKYGHNVLLWTQLDPNNQKKINKSALELGMPRDRILMDPTCATLGYGLEYSYSIYQRYHLAGLRGDADMAFPMSAGTTNAWGAREAWMSESKRPEWGLRELRGPLWECYTAICLAVAGMDLAMMFHPSAAMMFRELVNAFEKGLPSMIPQVAEWITMKV